MGHELGSRHVPSEVGGQLIVVARAGQTHQHLRDVEAEPAVVTLLRKDRAHGLL